MFRNRLVFLSVLLVLLAACGQTGGGPVAPSVASEPPRLLPFTGEPPIWPITNEPFDRIMGGVSALYYPHWERYAPVTERCAAIEGTRPDGDLVTGNAAVEGCLRPYLEELGVGTRALDLFFSTGIVVWDAPRTGPFWLAYGSDYDMFGSEAITPDYLFTSDGIFDVPDQIGPGPSEGWEPLIAARDAALVFRRMPEIREAYGEVFGMSQDAVGFWPYGETIDIGTPRRTSTGWVVPFGWRLLGCHLCTTPVVGRFELDATDDGTITGTRFIDACFEEKLLRFLQDEFTELGDFGLPRCGGSET